MSGFSTGLRNSVSVLNLIDQQNRVNRQDKLAQEQAIVKNAQNQFDTIIKEIEFARDSFAKVASRSRGPVAMTPEYLQLLNAAKVKLNRLAPIAGRSTQVVDILENEMRSILSGGEAATLEGQVSADKTIAETDALTNSALHQGNLQTQAITDGVNAATQENAAALTAQDLGTGVVTGQNAAVQEAATLSQAQALGLPAQRGQQAGQELQAQDAVYQRPKQPLVSLSPVVVDQNGKIVGATATASQRNTEVQNIDLLKQGVARIDELIESIEKDPTKAGAVGSLRRGGAKILGAANDVTSLFGIDFIDESFDETVTQTVSQAAQDMASGDLTRQDYNSLFGDSALAEQEILENSLAYIYAKVQQSNGRLLKDAIRDGKEAVKTTGIFGSDNALARLKKVKNFFEQAISDGTRRVTGDAPETPNTAGPKVGTVDSGYEFIGGDPADPANWRAL